MNSFLFLEVGREAKTETVSKAGRSSIRPFEHSGKLSAAVLSANNASPDCLDSEECALAIGQCGARFARVHIVAERDFL